jgi:kynurenine formamidase
MGREATLWLAERGMRVCGIDGWSWDPPLAFQVAAAKETGDYSLFWEGHKAGADCVYCHMEKLANLDQLPATGFEVMAFPVKVARASAGWCRPVALVPE